MKNLLICFLLFVTTSNFAQKKSAIETSGDILQLAIPATALASTYFYKDGSKAGWQFAKVYGTQLILAQSLKHIINKPRPDNNGQYAFPSGHTSSAFAGAAFIQRRYGWKVGIPAYVLASYVGYTRIAEGVEMHDGWDVLGGAVIGIGSAYLFTKPYKKTTVEMTLGKVKGNYMLGINYTF